MYGYYLIEILFSFSFLFLIILTVIRRLKIKNKVVATSMKELDFMIFISIPILIMAVLNLNNAIKYFNSILKHNYISDWHNMFNYSYMLKMESYFSKVKIDSAYWNITQYRHSIISFTVFLLFSLSFIILALGRKIIYEDGIYSNNGNYKWNKIRKYQWIDLNTTISKDHKKYISLYFLCVKANKISCFDETIEVSFKIDSSDKERVDAFLRNMLPYKQA